MVNPAVPYGELIEPVDVKAVTLAPPLGLLYLASTLEQKAFSVTILDMGMHEMSRECLTQEIERASLIGVTSTTSSFSNALALSREVKSTGPDIPVIMGGPHVTFTAEETVKEESVDVVVRGEGEETLLELAQYFLQGKGSLKEIPGITYKEGGIKSTPDRPFIEDLDALPLPARHLVDVHKYENGGVIITGRGCPYRCQFCAAGPLSGYRYRLRSIPNVIAELYECYREFGLRDFFFADSTFTAYPERTEKLCEAILALDLPITWLCGSRVNVVTLEQLELMAMAGCRRIEFGAESGSDQVLRDIQKGVTTEMILRAITWALAAGMVVECSFILGHPSDTIETIHETFEFVQTIQNLEGAERLRIDFGVVTPLPGTELWDHADELGITIFSKNWDDYNFVYPVAETRHLNRRTLRSLAFDALTMNKGVSL
ncbi:MAG: cobalamin B12-binding domain-containing protein [Theionarchaea archaeon]|nr:cobalamin B12-binding domain-containing protein [Theionarchaea archaeon]